MKNQAGSEDAKRRAGVSAASCVEDGDVVGLGTGSTAAYAIDEIARKVDGGLDVVGIPTSWAARERALERGLPLTSLDVAFPDVVVDGADVYRDDLVVVKGGGAAHTREKLVAASADRVVIAVDDSKRRDEIRSVPVEVLYDAVPHVRAEVEALGGELRPRRGSGKDGWVVSDHGNPVFDAGFDAVDAGELARDLSGVTGVVEHGLFVDLVDELHVGGDEGVEVIG